MSYDAQAAGADCAHCVLQGCVPVPAEKASTRCFAVIVGEAPGPTEVKEGRPFCGPSGFELQRALSAVGIRRETCAITNAVLCLKGKPQGSIERAEREVKTRNDALKGTGVEPTWRSPIEACAPRLFREVTGANVITLGGAALRAVTGRRSPILEVRGGPLEVDVEGAGHLRVLPTVHPAFVLRSRRWTHAFTADLARAKRWFETGLRWTDPTTRMLPSPAVLAAWLEAEAGSPFVVYDVETAPGFPEAGRYDPQFDPLRVVGLASHDGDRAIVIPFRSVEDVNRVFYSDADYRRLILILHDFFASSRWRKVGHNSGYYDRMVVERHFKVTPRPHLDTIGLHKFVEPELPHNLGYVGSIYTDIHSWKQGKPAEDAASDSQLWIYNARDCAVTARAVPSLTAAVEARKQGKQAHFWPFLQSLCVDLHKAGMYVDQEKRAAWDRKLLTEAMSLRTHLREWISNPNFNPNSTKQVRALLFDRWELAPAGLTESGDPSTSDDDLRKVMAEQPLTDLQRSAIGNLRLYRRRTKYRGTYTLKLRPMDAEAEDFFSEDEEETWEEREHRREKELKKLGIVLADGRVHADYNAHGTLGWRLSSSGPNMQNVPKKLRDIFVAPPGRTLVGCDQAQLELRMAAGLARSRAYLEAFGQGEDPHRAFCYDIFGREAYERAANKDALRRLVKELTYASQYRAEIETVHRVLTSAEDNDERLIFPDITLGKVGAMHRKWVARSGFERWWEEEDATFARQGYLVDPILGLRVDFLDGSDDSQLANKLVNFRCQSGGAAIVHLATKRFVENAPKAWREPSKTGLPLPRVMLVQQGHDSLVAECDDDLAQEVGRFMEECFTFGKDEFGLGVRFLGEMKVGHSWKEV